MMLRTAGGLFVFQSSVFRINEKLHNVKQGLALTRKLPPQSTNTKQTATANGANYL